MAIRLHLCIVEWPVELKLAFPNVGFAITHIKEAGVLKVMVAVMKARYLGTDDAVEEDMLRIISWTEDVWPQKLRVRPRPAPTKQSDDNESNDNGAPNASKKHKSWVLGGHAAKCPRTVDPSTALNTIAPATGASSGMSGNSASSPGKMMCRYVNRQDFSESFVGAAMKYRNKPMCIQCQTQV
ncbi:hypothetical protein B0H17DRAFT_1131683 [Mycena rosella]|uniref:Uncharacterized protein n=1 Tax=Mycena rosella TaxID=1033263 RepID=A0AAD7GHG2_MYCRO|nr:hypothetical protein B0H17DRAFT_1131683 [Mycena rosella]